jgi:hypothetical protein
MHALANGEVPLIEGVMGKTEAAANAARPAIKFIQDLPRWYFGAVTAGGKIYLVGGQTQVGDKIPRETKYLKSIEE